MKIVGVILAGGESRRMGRSKALLTVDGHRQIDRTIAAVRTTPGIEEVVVSGDVPETRCVPDRLPHRGPVGGITTVAETYLAATAEPLALLVVPVDLPRLTSTTLSPLVQSFRRHRPRAVCFEGSWLPALFLLDQALVEQCQETDSIQGILKRLSYQTVPASDLSELSNANTPEEWARFTRSYP